MDHMLNHQNDWKSKNHKNNDDEKWKIMMKNVLNMT